MYSAKYRQSMEVIIVQLRIFSYKVGPKTTIIDTFPLNVSNFLFILVWSLWKSKKTLKNQQDWMQRCKKFLAFPNRYNLPSPRFDIFCNHYAFTQNNVPLIVSFPNVLLIVFFPKTACMKGYRNKKQCCLIVFFSKSIEISEKKGGKGFSNSHASGHAIMIA